MQMTDDLGFPIVEIVEPPSSPTSAKRKAPPPISPVSRRTEKQRAEARKRAFAEAEVDEQAELALQAKTAAHAQRGQMKTLKGQDGKDVSQPSTPANVSRKLTSVHLDFSLLMPTACR
jgi:hypothetical protein